MVPFLTPCIYSSPIADRVKFVYLYTHCEVDTPLIIVGMTTSMRTPHPQDPIIPAYHHLVSSVLCCEWALPLLIESSVCLCIPITRLQRWCVIDTSILKIDMTIPCFYPHPKNHRISTYQNMVSSLLFCQWRPWFLIELSLCIRKTILRLDSIDTYNHCEVIEERFCLYINYYSRYDNLHASTPNPQNPRILTYHHMVSNIDP